jgi:ribose/xylose/arabinose/galactoside ABC-type transport system permease subunit
MVELLLLLGVMIIFFSTQSPYFFTLGNLLSMANQMTEVGLISIAMTVLIISGAIDLSVGSILGLSAMVLGLSYQAGLNIWLSVALALVSGLFCGGVNGLLIARYRMQAIVVTIGTMVMLRGVIYVLSQGRPISGYPDGFYVLGQGTVMGIPLNTLLLVLLFVLAYLLMNRSRFGRYIYALGNNAEGLRYSGINVVSIRLSTFVLSGFLAAMAGVFLVSRLASAEATSGQGIELDVITAVLLGGSSIAGGSGGLGGTVLGLLIIAVLRNGLDMMGVSVLFQNVILGVLILIAVGRQKR